MKKLTLIIFITFIGCSINEIDDNSSNNTVTFTGFDGSKCGCCWGYEIKLSNGKAVKAADFPSNLDLATDTKFPFKGIIKYEVASDCSNHIEISSFQKVN
jgi:hypothetical protein